MDADRFETLVRSLTVSGTRRRSLLATLGIVIGSLGMTGSDDAEAAKSGKCTRLPGECETCTKGKCQRKNGKKSCKAGKIAPKAEGTGCSGGTCQNGQCISPTGQVVPPPPQPPGRDGCPDGTQDCSGSCVDLASDSLNCGSCGARCQLNAHCSEGACLCGFRDSNAPYQCCPNGQPICNTTGGETYMLGDSCVPVPRAQGCPVGYQTCIGPECETCCPPTSTCDLSTGTCLQ